AIAAFLTVVLYRFLAQTRLGRVFPELRCVFGPPGQARAYVSDLVYVSEANSSADLHLPSAPDRAIEILSPGQHWPDFLSKIQFYLLNGVRLVWIVDPATRTVTVEQPGQDARILQAGDVVDGGAVLPGFSVSVDQLFAEVDRR